MEASKTAHCPIEQELSSIYAGVRAKWDERKSELFDGQCGFSILGSRPSFEPELMIVGENPGFGAADIGRGPHIEASWPDTSYFDGETWALKQRLRELFTAAGLEREIRDAVVTNFLFFKSGSLSRETDLRWSSLPRSRRHELENFCSARVRQIVDLLQPKTLVVLGMRAFDQHARNQETELVATDGKRRLIVSGKLFGIGAFALMHPTGARWSTDDWHRAAEWLRRHFHGFGGGDL